MAEPASQRTKIRPAAVAGSFYVGHAQRLRAAVADLLAAAPASAGASPKALIAPHAGYVYSGGVAAAAFATLKSGNQGISRVVLIGPAHYVAVRGIAVPTADAFETPLGRVPVDRDALSAIAARLMLRTRPSTRSRSSCPSCKRCSARSRWFRCWSAMPIRGRPPRCWHGCGAGRTR